MHIHYMILYVLYIQNNSQHKFEINPHSCAITERLCKIQSLERKMCVMARIFLIPGAFLPFGRSVPNW